MSVSRKRSDIPTDFDFLDEDIAAYAKGEGIVRVGDDEYDLARLADPLRARPQRLTKSQLVVEIAESQHMSRRQAAFAVDAILDTLVDVLTKGAEVEFRGFGKFSVESTGTQMRKGGSRREPVFKAGKRLVRVVEEGGR